MVPNANFCAIVEDGDFLISKRWQQSGVLPPNSSYGFLELQEHQVARAQEARPERQIDLQTHWCKGVKHNMVIADHRIHDILLTSK